MIAIIEDAIKARLAAPKLPYLRTIASYGGEFDNGLGEVVRQFPAFWVFFQREGQGKSLNTAKTKYLMLATFTILAGARNLRNEAAGRNGTGGDKMNVGVYQMLADSRALLLGQDLGLDITPLAPGRTQLLHNGQAKGQGLSIIAQDWHCAYVLEVMADGLFSSDGFLEAGTNGTGGTTPDGSGDNAQGASAGNPPPGGSGALSLPVLPLLQSINLNYHLQPDDGEADAIDILDLQRGRHGNSNG